MAGKDLTHAQCILLTVHYASQANTKALHSFTPTRLDALDPEVVLRLLLTYLPESIEPSLYTQYVGDVASRLYLDVEREGSTVDLSPVAHLDDATAQKKVNRLELLDLRLPSYALEAPSDILAAFLCHRAVRIDGETGLLDLVPRLFEPFLDRNDYLRTWYISIVLPLLRFGFEYYPDEGSVMPIGEFEVLDGPHGIDYLLSKSTEPARDKDGGVSSPSEPAKSSLGRDLKGLVGPWMYGHSQRRRRKLNEHKETGSRTASSISGLAEGMRKQKLDGVSHDNKTGHDWEYAYRWLVDHATSSFPLVTAAIEDWDGPGDVDLGDLDRGGVQYLDEDVQTKLEVQYAQAAFAVCYAVDSDTQQTIHGAHKILARLAELLDFVPPPDLASSVKSLAQIERHATLLDESQTAADIEPASLLRPEHPLTTPRLETYMLLQMMVYSAYQLSGLGHPISIVHVARLHFYGGAEEQLAVLKKILSGLAMDGTRDESQWVADRAKLMWLWNWGIDADDQSAKTGAGVLGKIDNEDFEEEMLRVFTETNCYDLAIRLFLTKRLEESSSISRLCTATVEQVVLATAMQVYDGASNGNRTRGGMRKASEIIAAFRPYFPQSAAFRRASALISATHALSFYSLKLEHGVFFKPVSIRVASDPVGLISKVLEQNPRSYTKMDDLVDIGQNLVLAGLPRRAGHSGVHEEGEGATEEQLASLRTEAERRVTSMAVEAALRESDFETAYSYVVNRFTPSGAEITRPADSRGQRSSSKKHTRNSSAASTRGNEQGTEDDISWRAAFLAGRYRPASASPPTLRRLEQRTELLSLALLLAPTHALTDILTAWRRCEEEATAVQVAQMQAEEEFDDRADKRQASALPGNFTLSGEQPEMVLNQKRREVGRMAASSGAGTGGGEEAPMSMFDLTRSAARAFSKNAFPLRGAAAGSESGVAAAAGERGLEGSLESLRSEPGSAERVRKRDVVANAVSGGLASGLGWVLGATPAPTGM